MSGTSHFDSDVVAKDGTETITGFATISATALKGPLTGDTTGTHTGLVTGDVTGDVDASAVSVDTYIQLGSHQYIFFGAYDTEATIVAAATAVDASVKGSLYLSSAANMWFYDDDDAATKVTLY